MSKMDLKGKLNQGLARNEETKFEAADRAMASGGLTPATAASPAPAVDVPKAKKGKVSRAPLRDSRRPAKVPAMESSIIKATFSMPPEDSNALDRVCLRAAALGAKLNRSEAVRLGIMVALKYLDDEQLFEAANAIPRIRTGRPS